MSYFRNVMSWLTPVREPVRTVSEVPVVKEVVPEVQESQVIPEVQELQVVPEVQESQVVPEVPEKVPEIQINSNCSSAKGAKSTECVWIVSLISCQERAMIPILATDSAQVGAYIRANVPKFLIFFRRLGECLENPYSEGDEIAHQLYDNPPASGSDSDLIASVEEIFKTLSDKEIVNEFYGCVLNGDNSYKVCIEGPLSLLSDSGSHLAC